MLRNNILGKNITLLLWRIIGLLALCVELPAFTLVDSQGRAIEVELIASDGEEVTFSKGSDGAVFTVSLERLSEETRERIDEEKQSGRLPDRAPPEVIELHGVHTTAVKAVTISPDGRWLVSAGFDGTVFLSDTQNLKQAPVVFQYDAPVMQATFSRDGRYLYVNGNIGFTKREYRVSKINMSNFTKRDVAVEDTRGTISHLFFRSGSDGSFFSPGWFGRFNLSNGKIKRLVELPSSTGWGYANSPDGKYGVLLAQGSSKKDGLFIYNADGDLALKWFGSRKREFSSGGVCFLDDKTIFFVGYSNCSRFELDGNGEWRFVNSIETGHKKDVTAIAFAQSDHVWITYEQTLVWMHSKTGDMTEVCKLSIGERLGEYSSDPINALCSHGDGSNVLVGCQDGTVKWVRASK